MRCLHCNHEGLDAQAVLCPACGVHLPSLMRDMLRPGTLLQGGRYRVEHALGQGGFGITYLARHATLKKAVAIKEFYPQEQVVREATTGEIVLRSAGRDDYERALRRFMREGETLAALDHPGVVRVNDQFEEKGTAYLVMDLVDGRTLREELDAQPDRRLPEPRVRELAGQLVSALEAVHERGVCHLDIKPDNVLLRRDGRAVLIDFGASKQLLTTRSTRAFTLEYAAPEVLSGEGVGPASDLFELGMLLYEALTGERPPGALSRFTNDTWAPDKAPAEWRPLLASALRLRRDERPATVREWWETLGRTASAPAATPTPPPPHAPPHAQQQPPQWSQTARPLAAAPPRDGGRMGTAANALGGIILIVLSLVAIAVANNYLRGMSEPDYYQSANASANANRGATMNTNMGAYTNANTNTNSNSNSNSAVYTYGNTNANATNRTTGGLLTNTGTANTGVSMNWNRGNANRYYGANTASGNTYGTMNGNMGRSGGNMSYGNANRGYYNTNRTYSNRP